MILQMDISIIIPTLGRETLNDVLNGILRSASDLQISFEVLVVFDGGLNTKIAQKYQKNPCFCFRETQEKVYSSGARNKGIQEVRGNVIAFLGDDTIPDKKWLERVFLFHQKNPDPSHVLLGHVLWSEGLAQDPFHQWLENYAQFDFKNLLRGKKPSWKHFYTSNISLKKKFLAGLRFSSAFKGWGFEDAELGYRLHQKGMQMFFDPLCRVYHHHPQESEKVWRQIQNSRKNAEIFERLHPQVRLVPRGLKKIILKGMILGATPFVGFSERIRWWRDWKKAWITPALENHERKD